MILLQWKVPLKDPERMAKIAKLSFHIADVLSRSRLSTKAKQKAEQNR
jgi:hypothetical protein